MKIYKTQEEVNKDIKNDVLEVDESVEFQCSITINASLKIEGDIKAWDIKAWDINARNINARNINARDILYHAFCCAYDSIKCLSIKGKRNNHTEPIALDGTIEIKNKEIEGK